jgi:hypothetical protein
MKVRLQTHLECPETRQCSQTFTRCSKQNSFVTLFLGHLHKPMLKNCEEFMQIKWEISTKLYDCPTSLSAAMIVSYNHYIITWKALYHVWARVVQSLEQVAFTTEIVGSILLLLTHVRRVSQWLCQKSWVLSGCSGFLPKRGLMVWVRKDTHS